MAAHHHQKATYDAKGNIIIPGNQNAHSALPMEKNERNILRSPAKMPQHVSKNNHKKHEIKRSVTPPLEPYLQRKNELSHTFDGLIHDASRKLWTVMHESLDHAKDEWREASKEARNVMSAAAQECHQAARSLHAGTRHMGRILKKERKFLPRAKVPRGPVMRFVFDAVRFGGTFALIFGILFTAMNYQSFLQIAKTELALGSDIQTSQALQGLISNHGEASTHRDQGGVQNEEIPLLAYLPDVGPYENRIVLPKIGKNLPIVQPRIDALLQEDWKKFEADIQEALLSGVVHYPGSAKPGQAGNAFFTAHSSYFAWSSSQHKDDFALLHQLVPGDIFSIYYGGDQYTYRVTHTKEVAPTDTSVLDQPSGRRMATLMTCTPVGTTLRRLIVEAEEIDEKTGNVLAVGQRSSTTSIDTLKHKIEMLPI